MNKQKTKKHKIKARKTCKSFKKKDIPDARIEQEENRQALEGYKTCGFTN